jgi:hypothetical protein
MNTLTSYELPPYNKPSQTDMPQFGLFRNRGLVISFPRLNYFQQLPGMTA